MHIYALYINEDSGKHEVIGEKWKRFLKTNPIHVGCGVAGIWETLYLVLNISVNIKLL